MSFLIIFLSQSALAVSCQLQQYGNIPQSANTKTEAEMKAWKACIASRVETREHSRGPTSEDDAILDAESCINAVIVCKEN